MGAAEILSSLGFTESAVVNERRGKVVVRVLTSRGWAYEEFSEHNLRPEIEAWVSGRKPG